MNCTYPYNDQFFPCTYQSNIQVDSIYAKLNGPQCFSGPILVGNQDRKFNQTLMSICGDQSIEGKLFVNQTVCACEVEALKCATIGRSNNGCRESLMVYGNAKVTGCVDICHNVKVHGDADICHNVRIGGDVDVVGNTKINGDINITGITDITGDTNVGGNVDITGDTNVGGNVDITGDINTTGVVSTTRLVLTPDSSGIPTQTLTGDGGIHDIVIGSDILQYIAGNTYTLGNATVSGVICCKTIITISDERYKYDIETLDSTNISDLRSVEYKMINSDRLKTGFIAQEVQKVLPEAVNVIDDAGHLGIDIVSIVSHLNVEIKQMRRELIECKKKIELLEKNNKI